MSASTNPAPGPAPPNPHETPRYYKLALSLERLPVELVHQVFSDLSLARILEVLGAVNPSTLTHLDECLLSHPTYFRVLFPDIPIPPPYPRSRPDTDKPVYIYPQNEGPHIWHIKDPESPLFSKAYDARVTFFLLLKQNFNVYLQLASFTHHRLKEILEDLNFGDAESLLRRGMRGEWILWELKTKFLARLPKVISQGYLLPVLLPAPSGESENGVNANLDQEEKKSLQAQLLSTSEWDWNNLPSQWRAVRNAEEQVKKMKYNQLTRISELIQRYPGRLRFGGYQSTGANNLGRDKHSLRLIDSAKTKLAKPTSSELWCPKMIMGWVFTRDIGFPLVPHDVLLRGFLKVLKKFPVEMGENNKHDAQEREGKHVEREKKASIYPKEIQSKITYVTDNMRYYRTIPDVYNNYKSDYLVEKTAPTSTRPRIPILRTLYTPYSSSLWPKRSGLDQPTFRTPGIPESPSDSKSEPADPNSGGGNEKEGLIYRWGNPFPEEEFVWLERFMEVCEFFEGIEEVQWVEKEKGGISVAEWWRSHVLS